MKDEERHIDAVPMLSLSHYWRSVSGVLSIILIVILIALCSAINYYLMMAFNPLGKSLEKRDKAMFYQSLYQFSLWFLAKAVSRMGLEAFVRWCKIKWRTQISESLVQALYSERLFLPLQHAITKMKMAWGSLKDTVDGKAIGQIVQEDVSNATNILFYFTRNVRVLGEWIASSIALYNISPTLTLVSGWVLPHYLFWMAWAFSLTVTVLSFWAKAPFDYLFGETRSQESAWRSVMMDLELRAGSILNTTGIARVYDATLKRLVQAVMRNMKYVFWATMRFETVQYIIDFFSWIAPYILMAPVILNGSMAFSAFFMVSKHFNQVCYGMQRLVAQLPHYTNTAVSIERIKQLQFAIDQVRPGHLAAKEQCLTEDKAVFMSAQVMIATNETMVQLVGFTIEKKNDLIGNVVHLCAPNGMGKTQLLKALVGKERIASKRVVSSDYQLHYLAQEVWHPGGKPVMLGDTQISTVEDYLSIGANGDRHAVSLDAAYAHLSQLGFEQEQEVVFGMEYHALSGGQKQKVALVRALLLAESDTILVLDEPFSAMDVTGAKVAMSQLESQIESQNLAGVLMVDHGHRDPMAGDVAVQIVQPVGDEMAKLAI